MSSSTNSMKLLALLLSLCWPSTAFSAPTHTSHTFANRQRVLNNIPAKHTRSRVNQLHLHLRIPRGGQVDEEFVDLDVDPDAVVNVDPDVNVDVDPEPPIVNTIPTQKVASVGALAPLFAVLQSAGSGYSAALIACPILTKSLTAGLTFFLSDYTAQHIEKPKEGADADATSGATTGKRARKGKTVASAPAPAWKRDWMRTIVSCAVGLFYFGPAAHYWYEWIFSILPSTSLVSTLQKAVLGQLIFGPSFTCIFFATSLFQAGQFNVKNWVLKIKRDLPGAWLSGVGFWPIVDLISFSLIPVKFIPLFINLCSFVWTIYLSSVANRSTKVE